MFFSNIKIIEYKNFQTAMATKLEELISDYIFQQESKLEAIPSLMATLLTAKWPRPYNKAIVESNHILFSVINAVMGWIMAINETVGKEV